MSSSLLFKLHNPSRFYSHQKLAHTIPAESHHSFSRVWAVVSYLQRQFPGFQLPKRMSSEDIVTNCWSEMLCQSITNEQSYVQGDVLHFIVELPQSFEPTLKQHGFYLYQYENKRPEMKKTTVIFINMSPNATFLNVNKFNLNAIFLGILFNNEKWRVLNPISGDMPTEEQFKSADIVIMPGSKLNISCGNQKVNQLKKIMKKVIADRPNMKFLGVCFGHQFLCNVMGGTVVRAKKVIHAIETVKVSKKALNYDFLRQLHSVQKVSVVQFHGDEVTQLPENFINVASSESCQNQIVVSNCGRYFGIQSHPDYTLQFLEWRSRLCDNLTFPTQQEDSQILRNCMKQFMK